MKIYKILGKRGRITIPFAIREELGLEQDDVLSFELRDDGAVVIRTEPRCCGCHEETQTSMISLQDLLDELKLGYNKQRQQAITAELADIAQAE